MDEVKNSEELRQEFQKLKREVAELKPQLNSFGNQKEEKFRELRSLRDKIKFRASKIQELKKQRDELTKQVKEQKGTRDKFNQEVKSKAEERKEVSEKKKKLMGEIEMEEDPVKLKQMIQRIQTKIETEVMPFEAEKKLHKKIKELQAKFKELEKMGVAWREVSTASANLYEVRKKAEDSHHAVQELAQQSQERHEEINRLYEELKKFREEEKPLVEAYLSLKTKFEQAKKELEIKQPRLTEITKLLHEDDERDFKTKVQERTTEVKEKLRKGKKLTTEDILAFQATRE
jgi:uncharacterized coiled-coil DUF342 family protein